MKSKGRSHGGVEHIIRFPLDSEFFLGTQMLQCRLEFSVFVVHSHASKMIISTRCACADFHLGLISGSMRRVSRRSIASHNMLFVGEFMPDRLRGAQV